MIKGTWGLLAESSSCCSKGILACFQQSQEEHRDTLHSTFDRRTCMASCEKWPNTDMNTFHRILHYFSITLQFHCALFFNHIKFFLSQYNFYYNLCVGLLIIFLKEVRYKRKAKQIEPDERRLPSPYPP